MSKTATLDLDLHDSQFLVHEDKSRFRILVTGRRWGKTTLALSELIENALTSNYPVWYIAPTYKQAKMIAWEMLKKMIPDELVASRNEVELEIKMVAGSPISLKGADNEDSLRGVGLSFVVLDEFASMKSNVWPEIVRPMLTDTKGRALFIGTPKGKNALFDLYLRGVRKESGYSSHCFKTVDNPFIDPDEIEDARKQMSDRYFNQEYEASFEDFVGLIWPEFDERIHVIEPFELPVHWESLGSIDPAMTGTTASLFSKIDERGNIYIFGEYYEQNKRISEVSSVIKGKVDYWVIDPASKDRTIARMGELYSIFDEFGDNGIYPRTAENDVNAGINRVAEYFKTGRIKIFSSCRNLINELERYHWAEERETTAGFITPKPYKYIDHACDCLRYLIMDRPSESFTPKLLPEPNSLDYYDRHLELTAQSRKPRGIW